MKKNFFKHIFLSLLAFFCWITILLCVAAYAFLTTTWGAKIASTCLIESYIPFCKVTVESYQGTIEKGLLLKDVVMSDILNVKDGVVHIQELYIQVPLIHWDQMSLKINNAKFDLSSADPIIFNGMIEQNKIKGNLYAHSVDAKQIVGVLGYEKLAGDLYGILTHLDFGVDGLVQSPRLTGHFFVDKFVYKNTQVSDGFGHLDLTILSLGDNPAMNGFLILESAALKVDKINIDLMTSKVDFKGPVSDFHLDIHGSSKIEDINIDMTIKGTFQKPFLIFNSDPPMPEEQIFVALVTGKSWSEIDETQGFGLRKKLTDSFNVGMVLEERQSQLGRDQTLGYSRTLQGQMNVTDKFSLNIAKKYLPAGGEPRTGISSSEPQKENESEIYLQYKNRF